MGWERDPIAPLSLDSLRPGLARGLVRSKSLTRLKAKGKAKVPSVEDPIPLEGQNVMSAWDDMSYRIANGSTGLASLVGR